MLIRVYEGKGGDPRHIARTKSPLDVLGTDEGRVLG
jgi:hypothetical protein